MFILFFLTFYLSILNFSTYQISIDIYSISWVLCILYIIELIINSTKKIDPLK